MAEKENKEIEKAVEELDVMSMNERERELYESRQRAIFEYNYDMHKARERGLGEGIQQGKKDEKMEIAKEMLLMGINIEEIQEATKLEKIELEKIIEEFEPKERELYEERQRDIFEYNYDIHKARERGVEEGKKDEKIEIVKKLLLMGLSNKQIKEATGISSEELDKIIRNN